MLEKIIVLLLGNTFGILNSSREILTGIKEENNKVLYFIYQNFFPKVERFVLIAQGNSLDAQDVFQDALVVIYIKTKDPKFEIKESFESYLFTISKFIWFKELRRRNKENLIFASREQENLDKDIVEEYFKMERKKLIFEYFTSLDPQYQLLLRLFYDKTPISEITSIMNYSSDQYTKNRRNYVKALLVKEIRKNPKFNELKNESFRENSAIPRW
ncbi:MAG: sigma-70 family RNA polymerase sigma factor [Bacteroidales bacterium]|nr:sigma-70 family RNA polymerase sigma factor [Bacteroidales bacterium]MCF8389280.1 sigma-70 family RNA polymerase sigma factor [Bacteroidales bacterium]